MEPDRRRRPACRGLDAPLRPGALSDLPGPTEAAEPYGKPIPARPLSAPPHLVRRLDRNRFRRHPGETLEETLAAAVRSRPDLSEDAARFLGLYHRDRFGPAPLPPEAREEAFRLANRLKCAISVSK